VPVIRAMIDKSVPTFGICLGHQMLGIALGGRTVKMHQGHHGANHPVKDLTTGKVEITSMNHGFAVDKDSLPGNVEQTHVSLFDGSNCGIALKDKPVFSVQYHPEASRRSDARAQEAQSGLNGTGITRNTGRRTAPAGTGRNHRSRRRSSRRASVSAGHRSPCSRRNTRRRRPAFSHPRDARRKDRSASSDGRYSSWAPAGNFT
jgi:gamma-glutamyl-gamma-aminobutyrate hydrolase PuuD